MALTPLPPDIEHLVAQYSDAWLRAEAVIKMAEFISGNVVLSSINELRYAGRRFNDFHRAWAHNSHVDELRIHLLEGAENCRKARHDAVDATIFHVAQEVDLFEKKAGVDVLAQNFPDYYRLLQTLNTARDLVSASREDRAHLDHHYERLEADCYPALIEHWKCLRLTGKVITAYRSRRRRDFVIGVIVVGVIVGVIAATLGGVVVTAADKRGWFDWAKPAAESAPSAATVTKDAVGRTPPK